jgi:hypothetical protein
MTLAHPALNMTGKRRGKRKFANAAAARQHRELQAEWERKQSEWAAMGAGPAKKVKVTVSSPVVTTQQHRETTRIASLNSWVTGAVASKPTQQYTGDQMLGIVVQHKSCLQPVFSAEAAQDSAKMRR